MTIDGTSQAGYSGTPLIELNGMNAGGGAVALDITAGHCTVRGLAIDQLASAAIELLGGGNVIVGNYIGTDVTGTVALANDGDGVILENGANNNTIGGSGAGNLISGNLGRGIEVFGSGTNNNVIAGNSVGKMGVWMAPTLGPLWPRGPSGTGYITSWHIRF